MRQNFRHRCTGILAPSEGTIEINGKDIQKDPLEAKRQFGFVPDDPDAFLRVRGIEYLNFMADIYGVGTEERQRFIEETAKRFEMEENLSSRIMSYSHGMRQKIMVMGALIHKPPVWILDEPLTGLDVYEEETPNVFEDRSDEILEHSTTARLLSFPNVMITSHQGFFTEEALRAIAETTLQNALDFEAGKETPLSESIWYAVFASTAIST